MKKFLILSALLFSIGVLPAHAADKPVVKIGATLPLTGDNAHLGESMRDAMILAKEALPEDTKYDYELIFEDDGLEQKRAAAATNKLISVDKVDAMSSLGSGTGGVVAPIANRNKVIHFGIASAQSVADGKYSFIHWTPPVEEARVMAKTLQEKGVQKLALFVGNHPAFIEMTKSLEERLENSDIEIVFNEAANMEEKDFRTIVSKAKTTNPDMLVLLFYSPSLEILTKQIREAGMQTAMTSIESFGLSNDHSLYEGQWYVDAGDAKKGFNEKFEKRFGSAPQMGAPNAYDIVSIIAQGYETAEATEGEKPTHEAVVQAIHKVKMDGMMGHITIDEKGVVFSPAKVRIIKDGKPTELEPESAE